MRTVHAAETSVCILISGEAPPSRGRMPALVRQALAAAGLPLWEEVEADCFRAGEDTLLLARPSRRRRYFRFASRQMLEAGASGCAGAEGALYRAAGGGYILAAEPSEAGPGLYEFGERLALSPEWELHAREQGACIYPAGALAALRRRDST